MTSFLLGSSVISDSGTHELVGRDGDLSDLSQQLEDGHHVVLVGPPGAGKTALAVRVLQSLSQRDFATSLIPAAHVATATEFAEVLLTQLKELNPSSAGDLAGAVNGLLKFIREAPGREEATDLLAAALDLLATGAEERGLHAVLALDDFDQVVLAGPDANAAALLSRHLRVVEQRSAWLTLMFLVRSDSIAQELFHSSDQPLYGSTTTFHLTPPSLESWYAALVERFDRAELSIAPEGIVRIIELGARMPLPTLMIADAVCEVARLSISARVEPDMVDHALAAVLEKNQPVIAAQIESVRRAHRYGFAVARRLARRESPFRGERNPTNVTRALSRLERLGLVCQPRPRTWVLSDPLLSSALGTLDPSAIATETASMLAQRAGGEQRSDGESAGSEGAAPTAISVGAGLRTAESETGVYIETGTRSRGINSRSTAIRRPRGSRSPRGSNMVALLGDALAAAVDALSAEMFESMAARYALVEFPALFAEPRMSPDAGATESRVRARADLGLIGLEIVGAREPHSLIRQLDRALKRVQAAGGQDGKPSHLIVVSRQRGPLHARGYVDAFASANVKLDVIGRATLIRDLCDPRHALIWRTLGVDLDPRPFTHLEDSRLFGSGGQMDIRPTLGEFRSGAVHVAQAVACAESALSERNFAIVRSPAASGKSVVAAHVGLRHEQQTGLPVYYIDCEADAQSPASQSLALESMRLRGSKNVLFIVDNIHSDPYLVRNLTEAWEELGAGSRLLLLGRRDDEAVPDGRPLDGVRPDTVDPIRLEVGDGDLIGIYQRLARRLAGDAAIREPSDAELRSWHPFRTDLVTFSLAIEERLRAKGFGDLVISPADAAAFVYQRYFAGRQSGDAEREALITVAVLGALELGPDNDMVAPRLLSKAKEFGLVRDVVYGNMQLTKTVHPRYARAILAAAGIDAEEHVSRLQRLCLRQPALVWPVVRKLETSEPGEALGPRVAIKRLLRDAAQDPNLALPRHLGLLKDALELLRAHTDLPSQDLESLALRRYWQIDHGIRGSDIFDLERTIEGLSEEFPALARYIVGALTERSVIEAVVRATCEKGPQSLNAYLRGGIPGSRLRPLLERWLGDEAFALDVAQRLGGLPNLGALVRHLHDRGWGSLAVSIVTTLVHDAAAHGVDEQVDEEAGDAIATVLSADETFGLTPSFSEAMLRAGCASVLDALLVRDEKRRADFGRGLAHMAPDALHGLLRSALATSPAVQREIVRTIPIEEWAEAQREAPLEPAQWYTLARRFRDAHRQDLVRVAARQIVFTRDADAWRKTLKKSDPISALTWMCVACGSGEDALKAIDGLLSDVCTPEWRIAAFHRNTAMGLAATMFAAAGSLEPAVLRRLTGHGFRERVEREVEMLEELRGLALCKALGVLGAAALVLDDPPGPRRPPSREVLNQSLRLLHDLPISVWTPVYRGAAVWKGVETLSERFGKDVEVAPDLAREALSALLRAKPPTEAHKEIRSVMMSWLNRVVGIR